MRKKDTDIIKGGYSLTLTKRCIEFAKNYNRYTSLYDMARLVTEITGIKQEVAGCGSCLSTKFMATIRNYAEAGKSFFKDEIAGTRQGN